VAVNRARTPSSDIRVVVVNSGNANACTGERGIRDAEEMARLAAEATGVAAEKALVMSTGIIGVFLPMDKIASGVQQCSQRLGDDQSAFMSAARGILTTDKGTKTASRTVSIDGRSIHIAGMCKGAGMIGPNMATMLGMLLTDARLTSHDAQRVLKEVADASFNCISVEGHMSTNDTLLLLASGAAGGDPLSGESLTTFAQVLQEMAIELAKKIPDDGEGASHLIAIRAKTRQDARQIASTIADSSLVKTAFAGGDPNWGRIVSAAGYSGVKFNPAGVELSINGHGLYRQGSPLPFDARTVSQSIKSRREVDVVLTLAEGTAGITLWTSDLTVDYVRFNADYST